MRGAYCHVSGIYFAVEYFQSIFTAQCRTFIELVLEHKTKIHLLGVICKTMIRLSD